MLHDRTAIVKRIVDRLTPEERKELEDLVSDYDTARVLVAYSYNPMRTMSVPGPHSDMWRNEWLATARTLGI